MDEDQVWNLKAMLDARECTPEEVLSTAEAMPQLFDPSPPQWSPDMTPSEKLSFARWYCGVLCPWGPDNPQQSPKDFTWPMFVDFAQSLRQGTTVKAVSTLRTICVLSGMPSRPTSAKSSVDDANNKTSKTKSAAKQINMPKVPPENQVLASMEPKTLKSLTADPDQTPVRNEAKAQVLREFWNKGDQDPPGPFAGAPTNDLKYLPRRFAKACMIGNVSAVEELLRVRVVAHGLKGRPDLNGKVGVRGKYVLDSSRYEVTFESGERARVKSTNLRVAPGGRDLTTTLLEHRFGGLRRTPLMFCIIGAKVLAPSRSSSLGKWNDIARVLLDRGARPDAKDAVGRTIVWYGTGLLATEMSRGVSLRCCSLLPKLVNERDRLGEVPLFQAIMMTDDDNRALRFLCEELHADATVSDYTGLTGLQMVQFLPAKGAIVSAAETKRERKDAKKKKKKTSHCGLCGKHGTLKCASCKLVFYCDRTCQKKHWNSGHREECRRTNAKIVVLLPLMGLNGVHSLMNFQAGGTTTQQWDGGPPGGLKLGEEFVVKVQIGMDRGPMMVYNETRTLVLSAACDARLQRLVAEKGVLRRKGYFRARVRENGKLEVFYEKMVTPKKW